MSKVITKSYEETIDLGERIGQKLKGGEVICLYAELGTGKTALTAGIAKGLLVKEAISSPSFPLLNEYDSGRLLLYHFDAYRLDSDLQWLNEGFNEYLAEPRSLAVIEWPERIEAVLDVDFLAIKIEMGQGENERIFTLPQELS